MSQTIYPDLEVLGKRDFMLYNFVLQSLHFILKLTMLTLLTTWKVIKVTNLLLLILVNLLEIQIKKLLGIYNGSE
jgi:hypothetical protein